ncbi:urease accessory protein [Rhizobium sp. RU20A]|uniref:HupE/UreJ family protein n=1 Tax=Rhizobium sp. RU20A TaxID=1907412 RepID=UPI000956C0F7|nr:HupE/UreJ family protein [Rhizobium sp. RU20A]SIQ27453.1 urease accessory protein [Rhizobium sp. RU20A]
MKKLPLTAAAALMLSAAPAFAHLNPDEHGSLMAGLSHPVFGVDHVLAMVAVGLWAAQIGGRAILAVPATFVTVMMLGFGLALAGMPLPFVEPAILASVVALGLLVAMAVKLDTRLAMGLVGLFALFHGHAHGAELGSAGALSFGIGFAISTALLHAAGIGLGLGLARIGHGRIIARLAGAATALAGVALMAG